MRVDTSGPISGDWSGQDRDATTVVRAGESNLGQVAVRLGIPAQDLQKANPEIADSDELSPGEEIRLPSSTAGEASDETEEAEAPADTGGVATSKRMDSNMDSAVMRASLSSAWGGGGVTHQAPVADPIHGEGYTSQEQKDLTDKLNIVYQSPQFQSLSPAERNSVLQALSSNPPLTQDKISKTLDLLDSAKSLSPTDRKLVLDGFRAAHIDSAYAANVKQLIDDPKFKSLDGAEKTAVLSQVKNYPDARTVGNLDRLVQKDWFGAQDLGDKQRSLKTVARFSSNPGDRKIIDNTLDKLIGKNSDYQLVWKTYPPGEGTYYGEGADKTLWLNKGIIEAGNGKIEPGEDTDRLSLNTVAHEINHLRNNDKVANTFDYFNAEYRAWYVGFQAQNGRVPTNQEAMEQRIKWQLNPESFYGKYAGEAMKNPQEAQKFYDFLGSVTGMKVDGNNWQTVVNSNPDTWKTLSLSPAPVPVGNNDNH